MGAEARGGWRRRERANLFFICRTSSSGQISSLIVIDVTKPNFLALARFSFFSDLFLNPKLKNVSLLELCLSAQSFLFMRVQLGASPVCQGQGVITLALSVCT